MIDLTTLARNDLSPTVRDWYTDYLTTLDAKDLDAYLAYFADDAQLFVNNEGPISGKAAIGQMLGGYWQSFGELVHEPLAILGDDREFMLEALNHYRRLDGTRVTVRAVAITARGEDGRVRSVRLYSDTSPLFTKG